MDKEKLPWMPLYVYDFLTDEAVQLMSLEQQGAYLRLLMNQWIEGSVPTDEGQLAMMLGVDGQTIAALMGPLWRCFEEPAIWPGRMFNQKLEDIREEQMKKRKELSEKGLRAANARWNASAMHTQCQPNATKTKTETESQRERTSVSGGSSRAGLSDSDLARAKALARFEASIADLIGSGPQGQADRTVAARWFDDWIWPPAASNGIGPKRMKTMSKLTSQAKSKTRPMAWLTSRMKKQMQ